ncbi:hypothetical protein BpHYR1_025057 [Brachionus plicatilis]|uniref:Uncharacterized protein n=1 Tax=Brachionus plicatilis TaxID=10195 RepID=A0A3M7SEL8_BRAPC|nr:hypothetical protein BpHYR1_025057 [Brachionus plicatilis]
MINKGQKMRSKILLSIQIMNFERFVTSQTLKGFFVQSILYDKNFCNNRSKEKYQLDFKNNLKIFTDDKIFNYNNQNQIRHNNYLERVKHVLC